MDKLSRLVDQILKRTEADALAWEQTAIERCFQVSLGERTIRIYEEDVPAEIGVKDFTIDIINSYGRVIESFSDRTLDKYFQTPYEYIKKMRLIFDGARRRALKVDDAIDDLLQELSENHIGSKRK